MCCAQRSALNDEAESRAANGINQPLFAIEASNQPRGRHLIDKPEQWQPTEPSSARLEEKSRISCEDYYDGSLNVATMFLECDWKAAGSILFRDGISNHHYFFFTIPFHVPKSSETPVP